MADNLPEVHYPDDLTIPFYFLPHGAPEPTEWLARHPNNFRIPATFIPRPARQARPTAARLPAATLGGSVAAPGRLSERTAPELAIMGVGEFLARLSPVMVAVGIMWPTRTASRAMEERPPPERFIPRPHTPALPGSVPPEAETKPGRGGFAPIRPSPPPPGYTPAEPEPNGFPEHRPGEH